MHVLHKHVHVCDCLCSISIIFSLSQNQRSKMETRTRVRRRDDESENSVARMYYSYVITAGGRVAALAQKTKEKSTPDIGAR